jgi:hypothetical protein
MKTNKGKNKGHDNLVPCKPGETHNPNGRPKGQRNYATIYRQALINIANAKGKTPEEIEEMIEQVGLNKAMKGDYNFFKDVRDRIHGKPMQPQDVTSGGEPITGLTINVRKDN